MNHVPAVAVILLAAIAPASDPASVVPGLGAGASTSGAAAEPPAPQPQILPEGGEVFRIRCAPCHGPEGRGVVGQIPPLRGSDYLRADLRRGIRGVLRGLQGEICVNGETYDAAMPAHSHLADAEIGAALTHVLGWSGVDEPVTAELVAEVRRESEGAVEVTAGTCPRAAACMAAGPASCRMGRGPGGCCGAMTRAARLHGHGRGW